MTDGEVVGVPESFRAPHIIDDRAPAPHRTPAQLLGEAVLALPQLVLLLGRLLRDPFVPRRRKLTLGFACAYLAVPVDLIPDMIPVIGQIDDVIVLAFGIHRLMEAVPRETRQTYWEGSEDVFDLIDALVTWLAEMVPVRLARVIGG